MELRRAGDLHGRSRRHPPAWRLLAVTSLLLGVSADVAAVFTWANVAVPRRQVTLRIGTNTTGVIDNVVFDVTGANVGSGTAVTAGSGDIFVQVTVRKPVTGNPARAQSLTVNSSAGLTCVGGSGCGTTVIPFTTISWDSVVQEGGTYANWDVPSGTFTGAAAQTLYTNNVNPAFEGVMDSINTLTFRYANTVVYPSGNYTGRVVFTAASL
ncbi:MAG: hypothetical protein JNK28_15335 [Burkholderiaceae bacterium]|jgi:hypothetical protein|nr:hypothetical protein [Burkholderiaceae bacterium]